MTISLGGTYTATTNAAMASYGSDVKLAYQGSATLRVFAGLGRAIAQQECRKRPPNNASSGRGRTRHDFQC